MTNALDLSTSSRPDDLVVLTPDHRYIHVPSGREIPSVSEILRVSGLRPAPFRFARRGPGGINPVDAALKRGVEVHRLTRAIDETGDMDDAFDDDFDPADISAETVNYLAADSSFRETSGYRAVSWEKIVYHPPPFEFAGRVDSVGWLGSRRILLDRKTDRSLPKSVWVQICAYKKAHEVCHPTEPIDRTYALLLRRDMTFALLANPIEDEAWDYFTAAYWMYRWKYLQV